MKLFKSLVKIFLRKVVSTVFKPLLTTKLVRLCLQQAYLPNNLRQLLLWPLTTHLLPPEYTEDIELVNGIVMKVGLEDMVNRFLLYYSGIVELCWEPQTARLALQLIDNDDVVIIGGAHIGYHTSLICENLVKFHDHGQVHAFEPYPTYFNRLSVTKTMNSYDNLYPHQCALGNKNTNKVRLYISKLPPSTINESDISDDSFEDVDCIALDDFVVDLGISEVALLFLDIEGAELEALKGATNLLSQKNGPDIIFEVNPQMIAQVSGHQDDTYNYIVDLGYDVFVIRDDYRANLEPVRDYPSKKIELVSISDIQSLQVLGENMKFYNMYATKHPKKLDVLDVILLSCETCSSFAY
ncbi:MAG TPA: hypothetical protein DGN60_00850 [Chloroflexi bacterium]|nr:hypothetical protein [Chloroflexota bacterium]